MSDEAVVEAPEGQAEAVEVDAGVDSSAEVAALRAQLEESQKRERFLKEGYVAAKKPHWVAEQTRRNPELATLLGKEAFAGIEAQSRREYERAVEALKETHAPTIQRLQALRTEAQATVESIREQAVLDARAEVEAAWGKPAGDVLPASAAPAKKTTEETLQALMSQ